MVDNGQNIEIARDSIKVNPNLMGESIKATQRLFLGYLFIKYISSDDFTITLNYRRTDVDSEVKTKSYTALATKNFLKKKLPPNITVTEFWLSISGSISDDNEPAKFECDSMGVLYDIVDVGMG